MYTESPMPLPRRLTLVIHSLAGGGAERYTALLANHWAERGDAVTLITLDSAATDAYRLDPRVERIGLDLMGESRNKAAAVSNNLRRLRSLRRAVRRSRPDRIVSVTDKTNVLTLLACLGMHRRVIAVEQVDPRRHDIGRVWSLARRFVYPLCGSLVVQTESIAQFGRSLVRGRPVHVIADAASRPEQGAVESSPAAVPEARDRCVIGMGRLTPQKGFDLLIQAFARIAGEHPGWTLRILGEGPERASLESLVRQYALQSRVELPGWVTDPAAVLMQADLFVLSSRYEGFPNALREAMACGLPVISFDCETGPAEIIRDGTDGLLVPAENVEDLAKAMDRLIADEDERRRLAARAGEVTERFSTERFFREWDAALSGTH